MVPPFVQYLLNVIPRLCETVIIVVAKFGVQGITSRALEGCFLWCCSRLMAGELWLLPLRAIFASILPAGDIQNVLLTLEKAAFKVSHLWQNEKRHVQKKKNKIEIYMPSAQSENKPAEYKDDIQTTLNLFCVTTSLCATYK
ncbi:unnamed protein product [Fraxinus pennsylvanica]|uniref:Uncharacterized protein n=1 Tax=Fraxinus pennsylvanica TaxID=56036 RepID=A0AAD1Z5T3_9LAMI|nr:unnamed protein product [Fraxinus pennsylvanica]